MPNVNRNHPPGNPKSLQHRWPRAANSSHLTRCTEKSWVPTSRGQMILLGRGASCCSWYTAKNKTKQKKMIIIRQPHCISNTASHILSEVHPQDNIDRNHHQQQQPKKNNLRKVTQGIDTFCRPGEVRVSSFIWKLVTECKLAKLIFFFFALIKPI